MFLEYNLSKKFTPYIYILFLSCFSQGVFSQNFELKIKTKDTILRTVLNEVSYKSKHRSEQEVFKEIKHVHNLLKNNGFFTSTIDTVVTDKDAYTAFFDLGFKTEEIMVISPKKSSIVNPKQNRDCTRLKPHEFESFTKSLLDKLDQKGKSFSEISYKNPKFQNKTLVLELQVSESKKRHIDKIIVKGYENFPQKFIKNFFKIDNQTIFSKARIEEISQLTKTLTFVDQKKKPEVLFKKDSTHLYLFLKKLTSSSFDGIINFASKEDGKGLLLNGNLDLKLNNVFNTGEQLELFWNKVAEEKTEFNILLKVPYFMNSRFSSELDFNIFRQDSTFLNTNFNLKTDYDFNNFSKLSLLFSSEKSSYLLNTESNDFDSYLTNFLGIEYQTSILSKTNLFKYKLNVSIQPVFGRRKTERSQINQQKLIISSFANFKTSEKSYVFLKNETGVLNSDNYLVNELFRIGGVNTIRGFNEQSIFTSQYSYLNFEYRYLTSLSSYIYTITDLGIYKDIIDNNHLKAIGIGIGYGFKLNNNNVNFAYANGFNSNDTTKFNNSKIIVKWTSFF